jgi:uracil-DNA glycosylase
VKAPASRRGFTDLVIKAIVEQQEHVVFLLWGNPAIERARTVGVREPPHRLIESAHPRGGRSRREHFKDVRHFSSAKQFLTHHRVPEVRWDLRDEG